MIFALSATLIFIVMRFAVTLFNFISNPKLLRSGYQYTDKVSVLIPARNEAQNILTLLHSLARQNYSNLEVIVLDDNSTDDTFAICEAFAHQHTHFKILKGAPLPDGWLGKNFACHQLAKQATGKYFIFLDADEEVAPDLINSAVHRMQLHNLALLSLFTNQRMHSTGELLVVPLMHYLLLNLLPVRLIYLTRNYTVAAASGQFMCFDADVYHKQQWHKQVCDKVTEDVEIMKRVKKAQYSGESLLANGLIFCRMYTGYPPAIKGFSKNFLGIFNYSITAFLTYIVLLIAGPLLVIMTLNIPLIFFMVTLIVLTRVMISLASGQNPWLNIIYHPIQMLNMAVIGFMAIQQYLTGTTTWKGRRV